MAQKASRGTPLATVAPRNVLSSPAPDYRDYSENLPEIQRRYLVARFGLTADRARLVAQIAWGGAA